MAFKLEEVVKARAKENQKSHGGTAPGKTLSQPVAKVTTDEELAKIAGVSHETIRMARVVEKEAFYIAGAIQHN